MKKILIIIMAVMLAAAVAGCGKKKDNTKVDEKTMYTLSSSLTKLSAAVESTVRYKKPPAGINDQDLLNLAVKHDPKLLEPFKEYKLRVLQKNKHAVVLVCSKDGKKGLLEDAGCSAAMDKHLWQSSSSCKFTLDPDEVCKK
ncbi:Uncharacterized protein dnl_60960 [Desulfonema limicola]|uniref:Lipoprotein n=1 Tax=Desulfonema limicola TaxID=45656 RepID=A0A975GJN9_9BACT|nr:hypothetical protein [Desulfonema limicola]QTA83682.1 Uncharacterized protein dnl_60960 [Desulfonema limicola]